MSDKLHFSLFALPSTRHYLDIYFDVIMMTLNLYEFFLFLHPKIRYLQDFPFSFIQDALSLTVRYVQVPIEFYHT